MTSEELLVKSKYFPRKLAGIYPTNPSFFAVDPSDFDVITDKRIRFSKSADEEIQLIRELTEKNVCEYSIMFYGKQDIYGLYFGTFLTNRGKEKSTTYSIAQHAETKQYLMERKTEVLYGHSHVAKGVSYNKFSITDLNYYVKRALEMRRDVYAILITRERLIIIVYDYGKKEFFRIPL